MSGSYNLNEPHSSVLNAESDYTDSMTTPRSNIPTTVETYSIHDEENDQNKSNHSGYVRLDKKPTSLLSIEKLKYPRSIDPYKIRGEIVFTVIIGLLIISIIGLTLISYWKKLQQYSNENKIILHGLICGLMLISFVLLIAFFVESHYWINNLMNSGFYYFPTVLKKRRIIVVLIWSAAVFLFSVPLSFEYQFCPGNKTVTNCWRELSGYNLLQIYVGATSLLVIGALIYYLAALIRFRIERRWPDIWHERLLEESSLIETCPIIQTCELRIEDHENTIMSTVNPNHVPTEEEIMKIQAYVIKYLRRLNNQLSERICQLNNKNPRQYTNYGSTMMSESRDHFNEPSLSSFITSPHNIRC